MPLRALGDSSHPVLYLTQTSTCTVRVGSDPIRLDQIRSDQIRSDQIRSDQIRSDQIRSDPIITHSRILDLRFPISEEGKEGKGMEGHFTGVLKELRSSSSSRDVSDLLLSHFVLSLLHVLHRW
jgi:hypothetical protein